MSGCTALNASMRRCKRMPVWTRRGNCDGTAPLTKSPRNPPTTYCGFSAAPDPETDSAQCARKFTRLRSTVAPVVREEFVERLRVGRFDGALFVDRLALRAIRNSAASRRSADWRRSSPCAGSIGSSQSGRTARAPCACSRECAPTACDPRRRGAGICSFQDATCRSVSPAPSNKSAMGRISFISVVAQSRIATSAPPRTERDARLTARLRRCVAGCRPSRATSRCCRADCRSADSAAGTYR